MVGCAGRLFAGYRDLIGLLDILTDVRMSVLKRGWFRSKASGFSGARGWIQGGGRL